MPREYQFPFELRHLIYFQEVARQLHFRKAAETLAVATAVPGAAAPQAASNPIIATAPAPVVTERRKERRLAWG